MDLELNVQGPRIIRQPFPSSATVYARSQAIERVSRGTSDDIAEISLVDRPHPCLGLVPL